jgi:hypothetical protein
MTDAQRFLHYERDRPYPGMAWLIQRVEQLELENLNLRTALEVWSKK